MSRKENNTAGILAGLLAGAAAGVILGMLYAPEEGKETRRKIKTKANDLKEEAKNKYGEVSEKVKDQYGNISSTFKETASSVAHTVKDGYDKYKDQIVSKTNDIVKDVESGLNDLKGSDLNDLK